MKAKSSLHRYLAIITGGGWKPLVSVFALGLFSVSGAFGATYKLVNLGTAQSPVEFSDPSNWTVDGVSATTYPQSGDTILFGTASTKHHAYLALDKDYTISGITQKFNIPRLYRSSSAAADTVSLTFTGTVGGEGYQHYYVTNNTKMVFAQTSTLNCATGDANPSEAYVQGGGEIDVLGAVNSRHIKWVVRGGGKLYFAPTSYKLTSDTTSINDVFDIGNSASSIVFPNGLTVTGGNSSWRNEFKHNYGTVTFGGPFTSNSPWTYEWKAGVIAATADVTFGDTISLKIPDPNPNERNITVDAAAGASFTFPASTYFGTTVNLTKTGEGDVRFAGSTLPTTTAVNEGGFALCADETSYNLSSVTFAVGTTLKIGSSGITLSAFDASIANATFAALDGYIPASGATVLTCADSSVLAQAQAGLNASLASVGISVEIDGNSLVAESHYTFNSSAVSDMNDATGWVNNLAAPAGQPVIIAGSQTAAVMDGAVPAYSAIAVTDDATLTVAATRDLPATTLAAGTSLHVAAASVTATGDFATTGSGSVTVDVAADCVLDLSGVDVTTEATLVKTGDGTLILGNAAPSALDVQAGSLALQPYVEYDMSGVTLGNGVSVVCAVDGAFKPAVGSSLQDGNTIYTFPGVYNGIGGWNATANWTGGVVPGASDIAHVYGEDTVLTLDDATITLPAAFVVEAGATLSVAADINLPPVTVVPGATLDIASGAVVSIANGFSSSALVDGDDVTLPVLSIQSGATLNVPANSKFKNIDLRIFGTISETAKGHLYLGYAESGETTYFAMNATNATISTIGAGNSYAQGQLCVACSDVGGRVSVMRRIELNGVALDVSKYDGMYIGSNNPVDEPFEVLLENITKQYRGYWSFCGAVTATFRNCALSRPEWQAWEAEGSWNVIDAAKLIYENTTHYYEYPYGNSVNWSPVTSGAECFVLTNSTVMWTRPTGNHKGVMTVFDSFYDCAYDAYAPSKGQTLPDLFQGLGALNIPAASFCAIRAKDHVTWDANDDATERICKIDADVVFTGAGDLVVSNSVAGRYFEVTMQSGNNTCTGTLATYSPENFDAKFYFANGANWAGTVVAGNVALTNLTDGAAAATATFGSLDLAADFPIRVWKREGVYSADAINVGSFVGQGRLAPVMMSEGEDFARGDSFVVGKIAKGATLPAVATGWTVKARQIDGDDAYNEIVLKSGVGLQIVVR